MTTLTRALVLLALCAACETADVTPATQMLITVDSDLAVGTELTRVQVEIRNQDGERKTPRHTFALTDAEPENDEVRLPFSFGVAKQGQNAFQLRVTGLKDDKTVVDLRWSVSFEDQKTLGVSVFLGAVCAGKSCAAAETCYPRRKGDIGAGECAEVPAAATAPVNPGDELKDRVAGAPEAGSGGGAGAAGCDASKASDYFADADGDGHGNPGIKQSGCGAAPVGFARAGDDCCDTDNRAFPGQDQGDVATSTCPEVGFDFDCDGKQEIGWPHLRSGTCCTNSDQPGWKDVVPACGATGQFVECDAQCEMETTAAKQRCY